MKKNLQNKINRGYITILRRFSVVVLFCFVAFIANASAFQQKVSIKLKSATLKELLMQLNRTNKFSIVFNDSDLPKDKRVTVSYDNIELEQILKECLEGTTLKYKIEDGSVVVFNSSTPTSAQQKKINIKGKVIGDDKKPIAGATVLVKGTTNGAISDEKGNFTLTMNEGAELEISFVGYVTQLLKPKTDKIDLIVTMKQDAMAVDDVIVTGIFNRKKEGFTGSAVTISNKEIVQMTSNNVLRALDMLDPGFRMGSNNIAGSNPNAVPDFEMRGQSNMGNYDSEETVFLRGDVDTRPNQPLFVLDGIIGVSITKIMDMDPAQIESITILKDAAAMVIYGSRASNGVVVIESRAPEKGKLRVSYNGNYKIQTPDLTAYDLLNAADKLELERRAGFFDERYTSGTASGILNFYTAKYLDVKRGVNTYWLSQPVQTAFQHRHGIDLEGGDNTLRYKIYAGANFAPGVMKKTGVDSKNASIDLRYRNKKLLISNQMSVDYTIGQRTSPYGTFREYGTLNSYYKLYDENGNINRILDNHMYSNGVDASYIGEYGANPTMNPMYNTMYNQKDQSKSYELRDIFKVEYTPVDNLRLSADFNITKITEDIDTFKPSGHTDFENKEIADKGSYYWAKTDKINYNVSFTANYNKAFANKHLVSLFARYDIDERYMHNAGISMTGFPNDIMDEVFLGSLPKDARGSEGRTRSIGFVATGNYSFDQRYAFDASIRIDASSEFGRNNRYAPFWSVGARWNIDKEKFFKKSKIVNELVFRATYGITGTQGFSPYLSRQMYTYDDMMKIYHSSDVIGTVINSMGNPDIKWQQTENTNLGLDFNLFNGIISGRFEYYKKYTVNTLLDFSLAPSVGFNTVKDNMGNISNNGYEATIRIMPYNNPAQRLNFSIVANGGHNVNRIDKISNALKVKNEEAAEKVTDRPLPKYVEGYSQSIIWGVQSLGIDPITGREVFRKRNGEMTNEWNGIDQVPVGDTEPKLRGTISGNVNWGGLSVSVACRYMFGGQMYNSTLIQKVENANLRMNVDSRAFTERWSEPGQVTYFKGLTKDANGTSTKASSRFVMDNNELSITTINLQYRFEARINPFIKKLGLSSASVGLYLEDLGNFSTIKMERGIDYPFARQVSMSLNLVF